MKRIFRHFYGHHILPGPYSGTSRGLETAGAGGCTEQPPRVRPSPAPPLRRSAGPLPVPPGARSSFCYGAAASVDVCVTGGGGLTDMNT